MGLEEGGGGGLEQSGFYSPKETQPVDSSSLQCPSSLHLRPSFGKPVLDTGTNQASFCISRATWESLLKVKGIEEQISISITPRC